MDKHKLAEIIFNLWNEDEKNRLFEQLESFLPSCPFCGDWGVYNTPNDGPEFTCQHCGAFFLRELPDGRIMSKRERNVTEALYSLSVLGKKAKTAIEEVRKILDEEIFPCPACGNDKNLDFNPDTDKHVWCPKCQTAGPDKDSHKSAIWKWNNRKGRIDIKHLGIEE